LAQLNCNRCFYRHFSFESYTTYESVLDVKMRFVFPYNSVVQNILHSSKYLRTVPKVQGDGWGDLRERDHLEDRHTDRVILK
jgi:hypothetical protein